MARSPEALRVPEPLAAVFDAFRWRTNPAPAVGREPVRLHLGCGENVLPGFVNVDFLQSSPGVIVWDLLDRWPRELDGRVAVAFCEDLVEHFFLAEQTYLLASMNVAMRDGGVFRVLMPLLDHLLATGRQFRRGEGEFLETHFGVETGADAINLGMRFGGHRWLHDQSSFRRLAERCGFFAVSTSCEESTVPELDRLNLRTEVSALSFANDLRKFAPIERWESEPVELAGLEPAAMAGDGEVVHRTLHDDARVVYPLPRTISADDIVCIALRGANLSQFREHNYSRLYLADEEETAIDVDHSMASCQHTTIVSADLIRCRAPGRSVDHVRFDPSQHAGDHLLVGPMEIFVRAGEKG